MNGSFPHHAPVSSCEREVWLEVERILEVHNQVVNEIFMQFCKYTTDSSSIYPEDLRMIMTRGTSPYPLPNPINPPGPPKSFIANEIEKHAFHVDWSRHALDRLSIANFSDILSSFLQADVKNLYELMKIAVFTPYHRKRKHDYLDDWMNRTPEDYKTYPFLNGDGNKIPVSAMGYEFSETHTHFTCSDNFNEHVVRAHLENITEHCVVGNLELHIPRQYEAYFYQMAAGNFYPYMQGPISPHTNTTGAYKALGRFDSAEVKVSSWVPPNYLVAVDTGAPDYKPLALRFPENLHGNLYLLVDDPLYPLRVRQLQRFVGMSVSQRHMMAVHYIGKGPYRVPSFCPPPSF